EALGRVDGDDARVEVDVLHEDVDEREHALDGAVVDDEAVLEAAGDGVDLGDRAPRRAVDEAHGAADEIVEQDVALGELEIAALDLDRAAAERLGGGAGGD